MAFVLVAFVILFGLTALFYLSIKTSSLRNDATTIRQEQTQELIRKMAGAPEFSWTRDDCSSCVDMDKVMALKDQPAYRDFWSNDITFLQIKEIYGENTTVRECTRKNYPACSTITVVDKGRNYTAQQAFVALCRSDPSDARARCVLGKIVMGAASL